MVVIVAVAKNFSQMMIWFETLVRMERTIRGEPESIEERREKLEVKATAQVELKLYAPVFQELLDEGAITLDAVGIPQEFDSREGGVEGDEDHELIEFEE
jgi:hypothetical protein